MGTKVAYDIDGQKMYRMYRKESNVYYFVDIAVIITGSELIKVQNSNSKTFFFCYERNSKLKSSIFESFGWSALED